MKIEALQVFVAVAEQRNFSKAAQQLYLSGPTVSRYIAEMEKTIGDVLFIRNAHVCELTMLGKQVYVHARRIVNEWESLEILGKKRAHDEGKRIQIGFAYEEQVRLVTQTLAAGGLFSDNRELSIRCGDGADITRMVRDGNLDCAIMSLPSVVRSDGIEVRIIRKCNMCMHASRKHRYAGYDELKLEQLIYETDIRTTKEQGYYKKIDEAFANLGLPELKHVYVQSSLDCLTGITYRDCIGFSPDIYPPWPDCKKVRISDWTTDFSIVFVTRADCASATLEKLYKALCETLNSK